MNNLNLNLNLNNNYVLSGVVALSATIGLYIVNRKADDKVQYMSYLKHFGMVYLLIMALLFFKPNNALLAVPLLNHRSPMSGGNYQSEILTSEPNF